MYSISRIQQVFRFLPRPLFQQAVQTHRGDRHCKGFTCWDQLVSMVYAQLAGVRSLRELEAGFNQHLNQHYHLHTRIVRRTTLADANAKRNPEIFADTVRGLMQLAGRRLRHERDEMLYLLDSTTIALSGRGMQWTAPTRTRDRGLKVHVLYASKQQLPVHESITAVNVNDIDEGRKLPIQPGATYVFDKGYCDYNWWHQIDSQGARFVTRLKSNARVLTLATNSVPAAHAESILGDNRIRFAKRIHRGGHRNVYTGDLRRIEVAREGDSSLVLVTNDLRSPAVDIARLYKERWQIELFFKWVKQHLEIKRFLGQTENAVRIQVLTALIAYLLVALLKAAAAPAASMWSVLAQLRTGLFHRVDQELSYWRRRRQAQTDLATVQPGLFACP
jgi:IS4 transposase